MSVIRVGSTGTYAEGWDAIFGSGTKKKSATTTKRKVTKSTRGTRKPPAKATKARARGRK